MFGILKKKEEKVTETPPTYATREVSEFIKLRFPHKPKLENYKSRKDDKLFGKEVTLNQDVLSDNYYMDWIQSDLATFEKYRYHIYVQTEGIARFPFLIKSGVKGTVVGIYGKGGERRYTDVSYKTMDFETFVQKDIEETFIVLFDLGDCTVELNDVRASLFTVC